jgi:RsiW-degrading membrane proteinase PrsW (M82 family)
MTALPKALIAAAGLCVLALWWVLYFRRHDPGEREPSRPLVLTAGLGIVAGILCAWYRGITGQSLGWMTGLLNSVPLWRALLEATVRIGLAEELAKFLPVWLYSVRSGYFDEAGDGLVYATTSAVGFATAEAAVIVGGGGASGVALLGLLALPVTHGLFSSAWGWGIGRWVVHRGPRSWFWVITGFALASLAHGLYDVVLLRREVPHPLVVVPVLALWVWFMKASAPRGHHTAPSNTSRMSNVQRRTPKSRPPGRERRDVFGTRDGLRG